MKTKFIYLTLAALTIGLLGSCKKDDSAVEKDYPTVLTNNKKPFQYDTSKDCGMGGRFSQVTDWKTNQEMLVTYDKETEMMCLFSSNAFGVTDAVNAKVWQTIKLEAGNYKVTLDLQQQTRPFYELFFTACVGEDLPDIYTFQAGTAQYLGVLDFTNKGNGNNSTETFNFTVPKTGPVAIGWVYSTHTPDDAWPWAQLYINEISVEKQ